MANEDEQKYRLISHEGVEAHLVNHHAKYIKTTMEKNHVLAVNDQLLRWRDEEAYLTFKGSPQ
ncbi:MAG TPA: hypothetical protein VLJ21_05435, partial [Candidatus Binatia bacterium]|nr:hypothetical protein [Candidatus Binatia bacterium]